jgi:hypothetical protein
MDEHLEDNSQLRILHRDLQKALLQEMLQSSFPEDLFSSEPALHRHLDPAECPNLKPQISPLEHTRISQTEITTALYA